MPERPRAHAAGPRDRPLLVASGSVYVLAWLLGLLVAAPAPDAFAPAAEIHAHFAQHGGAALGQALIVHGVAGVALAVFVLALAHRLGARSAPLGRAFVAAGLGAAVVSLAQLGAEIALNRHVAGDGEAGPTNPGRSGIGKFRTALNGGLSRPCHSPASERCVSSTGGFSGRSASPTLVSSTS